MSALERAFLEGSRGVPLGKFDKLSTVKCNPVHSSLLNVANARIPH